ncbi:ABC transporter substrate-binding protein [Kutzneria buriramensis]|uniref:NitT/TauT family transport system substrate-binding protein n=1 Tax=Kutzneria buriramensis TaxID=1045776 RepID=A0A3E0IA47_9PSEU|nr:ABC transporter substrate-binding protein [Kutzneria buriramensis]REH55598.1 NitT/TauT family transport system substrate-binding protein [Kutzneria buriramensis]
MRRAWPALLLAFLTACSVASGATSNVVTLVVGYQSKTINTVTAGTLLRAQGYLEQRLSALGQRTGRTYRVEWQDYSTGAPITAQMVAGKIDIGSMGDFPLLINASRTQEFGDGRTSLISATGYNLRGALNMVVVPAGSSAGTLADLRGKRISASIGSAGHGTTVRALSAAGIDPDSDVQIINQDPAVGASALRAGAVDALGQFVAWPGQLVFAGRARLLYDGAALNLPTWHGVVVRQKYAAANPDAVQAFLQAQLDATAFLNAHPMEAAQKVAAATGLAPEVVYLYNGPDGLVTFDPTLRPDLISALQKDIPFLRSIGGVKGLDLSSFVDPGPLSRLSVPAVHRPSNAGEVWFAGASSTVAASSPDALLRLIRDSGKQVRAAYVDDTDTGTRWFADKSYWVSGNGLHPFDTESEARAYATAHPGSRVVDYPTALRLA